MQTFSQLPIGKPFRFIGCETVQVKIGERECVVKGGRGHKKPLTLPKSSIKDLRVQQA